MAERVFLEIWRTTREFHASAARQWRRSLFRDVTMRRFITGYPRSGRPIVTLKTVPIRYPETSVISSQRTPSNITEERGVDLQGEHKVFPWLKNLFQENYCTWNTIFFSPKCNSRSFFLQHISTLQHVLLLLHGERLIENQFSPRVLQHVFSYCSKSVCYSCLQICNIWNWCRKHFVLNIPP